MNKENTHSQSLMQVTSVTAFDDNYIWFIHGLPENQAQKHIIIVDPGEAKPVIEAIEEHKYIPEAIFLTHHHGDHTGGVGQLLEHYHIPVYGPKNEAIASVTQALSNKDTLSFASMGLNFSILDVPGHTIGHIAYLGQQCLFIGDTLFTGGCGRIFEGTSEQMHHSLAQLLALDKQTQVYCAHEYTLENLKFALIADPDNSQLRKRMKDTQQLRDKQCATVPSSLALELQTNPFLRFNDPAIKAAAEQFAQKALNSPAEVFKTIRYWKDTLD